MKTFKKLPAWFKRSLTIMRIFLEHLWISNRFLSRDLNTIRITLLIKMNVRFIIIIYFNIIFIIVFIIYFVIIPFIFNFILWIFIYNYITSYIIRSTFFNQFISIVLFLDKRAYSFMGAELMLYKRMLFKRGFLCKSFKPIPLNMNTMVNLL